LIVVAAAVAGGRTCLLESAASDGGRYNALTSFQHLGLPHQLKKLGAITDDGRLAACAPGIQNLGPRDELSR
jgi:hypothetical protein